MKIFLALFILSVSSHDSFASCSQPCPDNLLGMDVRTHEVFCGGESYQKWNKSLRNGQGYWEYPRRNGVRVCPDAEDEPEDLPVVAPTRRSPPPISSNVTPDPVTRSVQVSSPEDEPAPGTRLTNCEWAPDLPRQILVSRKLCGDTQRDPFVETCSGYVVCDARNREGVVFKHVRLSACSKDNCKDETAMKCTREGGYGSGSVEGAGENISRRVKGIMRAREE